MDGKDSLKPEAGWALARSNFLKWRKQVKKAVTFLFLLVLALGPTLALLAQQGGGSSSNGGSLSVGYNLPLAHGTDKNMVSVRGEISLLSVQNNGPDPVTVCWVIEESEECKTVLPGEPFWVSTGGGPPITTVSLAVNDGDSSSGSVGIAK